MNDTPSTVLIKREIPVREDVDVFVAGGGPAGMAAAVTAARQGCRVFLAEAQNCLGGMGTAGMLPIFMAFGDAVHFYAGGFGREMHDRLKKEGATTAGRPWGRWLPPIRVEGLKRLYDEMAVGCGLTLGLVTQVVAVEAEGGHVRHVICAGKSGLFAVKARIYVDCTGDGDLAAWAGAAFEKGDRDGALMPGTLCSLWTDVDWAAVEAAGQNAEEVLIQALRKDPSVLPQVDPHLPGMVPVGKTLAAGNVGHSYGVDGTDERSLTQAVLWGRKILAAYERFYRRNLRGYEQVSLAATASLFGVRESRRILGDYVLVREDFARQASFPDEIGRYNYWVDIHCSRPGFADFDEHMKLRGSLPKPGESYGIPYRILTPRGLDNLLVAGRSVSTDRHMQASIRVMPGCYITGQAAGLAAALAARAGTSMRGVPIAELQAGLKALGAFLPNFRGSGETRKAQKSRPGRGEGKREGQA
jgi:hypothetical protein